MRRAEEKLAAPYGEYVVVPRIVNKHVRPANAVRTKLRTRGLGHTKNAYTSARNTGGRRRVFELSDFFGAHARFGPGWRKESFDGLGSIPVTDEDERVITAICGGPGDPTWKSACAVAADNIEATRGRLRASASNYKHRRGDFLAMAHGVSYGGGQKVGPCIGLCLQILTRRAFSSQQISSKLPIMLRPSNSCLRRRR